MTVLLDKGDLAGAQAQFAGMQKALPAHPQTRYFEGMLALLAGDLAKAGEVAEQLLRRSPSNPLVLELAGGVEVARRAWPQAEAHLARAVQLAPGRDPARRLLAQTYLERAQPDKALATLQPLVEGPRPRAVDLKLKAQAHLLAGQFAEAAAATAEAARTDPGDTRSRTALAIAKVLGGDASAGLADLQSLAAARDDALADLPLIATLVRKKDYAAALKAVDALEKKQPGQPLAPHLRGRVLAAQGDKAGAAKAFERALQLQPAYFPAAAALAQLALDERKPDEAQARLDAVVKADPTNAQALLASARLKARRGAPRDEVVAVFADAIQRAPTDPAPRLALVDFHLRRNDPQAALSAAQQSVAALPDQPAQRLLVDAYVAERKPDDALAVAREVQKQRPAEAAGGLLPRFRPVPFATSTFHEGRWGPILLHCLYRNLYHHAVKTTLDLNDQLLADAKALAARQRTSLTHLIEEGLQLRLRATAASAKQGRVRLPVFKGRGGLVAGVDPLSNKALLEALGDDA